MRYFGLLDFQTVILLTFLGLIGLVLLYMAFMGDVFPKKGREDEDGKEEFPGGIKISNNPIPSILIFVYVGFILWAIAYVIMIGLRGGPF